MAGWEKLSAPKNWGGWGIKHLFWFNAALRLDSFWRGIFRNSFSTDVLRSKYIKQEISLWIRNPKKKIENASPIWKGFIKIYQWLGSKLAWNVGNGKSVIVGVDPIPGMAGDFQISSSLVDYLAEIGYDTLSRIKKPHGINSDPYYWYSAKDLGISGVVTLEWDEYILRLNSSGCRLNDQKDTFSWISNSETGTITAKSAYLELIRENLFHEEKWWFTVLWKWKIPLKMKCFMWLALQNSLKTWDNLLKRGWHGPNSCSLCKSNSESIDHILVSCHYSSLIWEKVISFLKIDQRWGSDTFEQNCFHWQKKCKSLKL